MADKHRIRVKIPTGKMAPGKENGSGENAPAEWLFRRRALRGPPARAVRPPGLQRRAGRCGGRDGPIQLLKQTAEPRASSMRRGRRPGGDCRQIRGRHYGDLFARLESEQADGASLFEEAARYRAGCEVCGTLLAGRPSPGAALLGHGCCSPACLLAKFKAPLFSQLGVSSRRHASAAS